MFAYQYYGIVIEVMYIFLFIFVRVVFVSAFIFAAQMNRMDLCVHLNRNKN